MRIKKAEFLISVADKSKAVDSRMPEIAVAGKSNVGKSSFINFLTNNGKLAKTSSTPGRTRLLNYFVINDGEFTLVDLPGYGYARVNDEEKRKWADLIEGYLTTGRYLANVFVIVDIRHDPTALDKQMINFLQYYSIPFTIVATKCDKLSKTQVLKSKKNIAAHLAIGSDNIIAVSSMAKTGKEEVLERIEQILENFVMTTEP